MAAFVNSFARKSAGLWSAVAAGLVLAACASAPIGVDNSEIFEPIRNSDLSARTPERVRQTGSLDPKGKNPYEYYPGQEPATPTAGARPGQGPQVQQRQTSRGEGYELNFENANLSDVVKVILGDTLKEPYVYDPRIQAQVTLSTGRAVSRVELLHVLETVLGLNNAVLVNGQGGYKILPQGEAGQGETGAIKRARADDAIAPGQGISVLPLYNVTAESMLQLLDSFIARAGSLKADAVRNLLLIRGSARERQSLIEVASSFDVDWLKDQSAGIFPLEHSTPEQIIGEINKMLANEGSAGTTGPTPGAPAASAAAAGSGGNASTIRLQPISRLNAVLVLARKPQQLREVATWIKRLDRTNSAGLNTFVYKVENAKAGDLASVLSETFGISGGRSRTGAQSQVAPGQGTATAQGQSLLRGSGQQGGQTGQTGIPRVERPSLQRPQNTAQTQQQTPQGPADPSQAGKLEMRIVADEVNNTLLIRATAAEYEKILAVLRQIDRPPLQVLINATIAEVTLTEKLRYGVQVYLKGKYASAGFFNQSSGSLELKPVLPGFNFFAGSVLDPRAVLDALATVTNVKVISSPSLVVVDNQPAILQVGDEVPVTTQQASSINTTDPLNPNVPIVSNIQFRDTGVILKVTPRVNSNGLVTMDVEQEISNVKGSSDSTSLTPTIAQRRIASTVAVLSGQTVVLGGLISESQNREKTRVPILEKIPLIGDLIGSTNKEKTRTELIVFIRPQVMRNSSDAANVAEELRAKLKLFEPDISPRKTRWDTETSKAKQ